MRAEVQVNDESWRTSVAELDLTTQGRYIACALIERVRGFDTPDGSGVLKTTFPMMAGEKIITTRVELMAVEKIKTPCRWVDSAAFMQEHQDSNSLALRWMVDTMKALRALSVLRKTSVYVMEQVGYYDFKLEKEVKIDTYILVGVERGHHRPDANCFVFSRTVKE